MLIKWEKLSQISSRSYVCGYCGNDIASNIGFLGFNRVGHPVNIYICHKCDSPTFFDAYVNQFPSPAYGDVVKGITDANVQTIYEEARHCLSVNAFTASVLCCRKLLMNIAVSKGATQGLKFIEYVEFLSNKGFVPPDGKEWVDHIRTKGNEATHEINIMTKEDSIELLSFSEMLLKFIFEFPIKMKIKSK
jgi:Domain of unknown function (DUF4145)